MNGDTRQPFEEKMREVLTLYPEVSEVTYVVRKTVTATPPASIPPPVQAGLPAEPVFPKATAAAEQMIEAFKKKPGVTVNES